jgi:hypothetical protein
VSLRFERALAEWRECRAAFEDRLEAEYALAERETGGALLNDRGRDAGVNAISLFMGNRVRAYAYASPELVEYWERRPRVTFAQFEASWPYPEDDEIGY